MDMQQPHTPAPMLFAWAYPTPDGLRVTVGEHIDEPVAELDVVTYHQCRDIAKLYGARPRNF